MKKILLSVISFTAAFGSQYQTDAIADPELSLKEAAKGTGVFVGAALDSDVLWNDSSYLVMAND